MKTIVCAFFVLLLPVSAAAQQRTFGRAFLNDPVGSAEEYARVIERCDLPQMKELNLGCEELVRSFNENFDHVEVTDFRELAAYVRTLSFRPCPQVKTSIARVVNSKVNYFDRMLRQNEMCLVDLNHNVVISSAVCGQWTRNTSWRFTTNVEEDPATSAPGSGTPLTDAAEQAADNLARDRTRIDARRSSDGSWFSWRRNGKWFWPVVGAGVGVAYCTIPEPRCFKVNQTVIVTR